MTNTSQGIRHGWPGGFVDFVRWTALDCGGHFLAMEAPDLLVDNVRTFFGTLR